MRNINPYRVAHTSNDYTSGELAWFKRPLRGLAMVAALVIGSSVASAQPRPVALVATAKVATVKPEAPKAKSEPQQKLDIVVAETHMHRDHAFKSWVRKGK